ncbi:MAG: hypothetical protein F4052_00065 [Dehalococcoidia bacterium]|nr:hypothetical protein [Dehalococcoidia bacterium]
MATTPSRIAPADAGAFGVIGRAWRRVGSYSPLAWLVVTPVVTAPLTALLVFGFAQEISARSLGLPVWRNEMIPASLHYFDFWLTALLLIGPGLVLNLLVVLWFFQRNGYLRVAAALALVLALVRTVGVLFLFFAIAQSDLIIHDGQLLMRIEVERTGFLALEPRASTREALVRLPLMMWLFGAFAWGPSVLAWGLFNLGMERLLPHLKPPQGRQAGTPRGWGGFFERRQRSSDAA